MARPRSTRVRVLLVLRRRRPGPRGRRTGARRGAGGPGGRARLGWSHRRADGGGGPGGARRRRPHDRRHPGVAAGRGDRRPRRRRARGHRRHADAQGRAGPAGGCLRRPPGWVRHPRGAARAAHRRACSGSTTSRSCWPTSTGSGSRSSSCSSTCTESGSPARRAEHGLRGGSPTSAGVLAAARRRRPTACPASGSERASDDEVVAAVLQDGDAEAPDAPRRPSPRARATSPITAPTVAMTVISSSQSAVPCGRELT